MLESLGAHLKNVSGPPVPTQSNSNRIPEKGPIYDYFMKVLHELMMPGLIVTYRDT